MVLFIVFGDYVGLIFTNDTKVVRLVAKLSVLGGLYQIPDCIYGSVSGILRCMATARSFCCPRHSQGLVWGQVTS